MTEFLLKFQSLKTVDAHGVVGARIDTQNQYIITHLYPSEESHSLANYSVVQGFPVLLINDPRFCVILYFVSKIKLLMLRQWRLKFIYYQIPVQDLNVVTGHIRGNSSILSQHKAG